MLATFRLNTLTREQTEDVLTKAQDAFWEVIAKAFPTAAAGDFPPDATQAFDQAINAAARLWIRTNVPEERHLLRQFRSEDGYRFFLQPDWHRHQQLQSSTGRHDVCQSGGLCRCLRLRGDRLMPSSAYPQSWTTTYNAKELERTGHSVYYRGDGAHHDPVTCGKCREDAAARLVKQN